jgi:hypothetical protein
MPSVFDPARFRARLLAELPSADPRLLARREGRVAWFDLGGTTLALSVAARQLPGLARPSGEAAAAGAAVDLLRCHGANPLGVLQGHRLGDGEAPGIEGRVRALREAALAPGIPALGGTVDVHPARAALLQTHAFALGLGKAPEAMEESEEESLLSEGLAPEPMPWQAPADLSEGELEAALRRVGADPALADPAPLCGPTPAGRAALLDLPGSRTALAFACADAAAWTPIDPFWAAAHAVAAAARRVACVGAEPAATMVALCLGPEDDAQAWALQQALAGLRQACLALELPVAALEVVPCPAEAAEAPLASPMVAVVGILEEHAGAVDLTAPDAKGLTTPGQRSCGRGWRAPFEAIYLLGAAEGDAGGSVLHRREGPLPDLHLDAELRLQRCLREGIGLGLLRSARDLAEGGLLGAAVDASLVGAQGCQLMLQAGGRRRDALLFGEGSGRVLVGVGIEGESALRTLCATHRVPLCKVGVAGGPRLGVAMDGVPVLDADLADLGARRDSSLGPWLG